MGQDSMPSSSQRDARGCLQSTLLRPEHTWPGPWAAATGLHRRAKGQRSPFLLLLLLLIPPAAKEPSPLSKRNVTS